MEVTDKTRRSTIGAKVHLSALLAAARTAGDELRIRAGKDAATCVCIRPATNPEKAAAVLRSVSTTASRGEAWPLSKLNLPLGRSATHGVTILRIVFRRGRVIAVRPLV